MGYTLKSPETEQEWHDYYQLRWQVLRAPWQQPLGSERDELENRAIHLMAIDDNHQRVGVGRIHRLSNISCQIRYMAVHPDFERKGIGSILLAGLEQQARDWRSREIVLNARTTCLVFYQKRNYKVIADAPTLFGSIVHKRMRKLLV
jgi:GNAT superfamily N-acetyltransferase